MLAAAQTKLVVLGQSGPLADLCTGASTRSNHSIELLLSVDGGVDDSDPGLCPADPPAPLSSCIVSISAGTATLAEFSTWAAILQHRAAVC
jgi:hypothetical protein